MSNVRIEATGEESLSVDVTLGGNLRASHSVEAGASVDLTVGGNQKLVIKGIESAVEVEVPTLEQGADVAPELPTEVEDFDVNTDADVDDADTPADEEIGGVIDDREEGGEDASDDHGFFDCPECDEKEEVVIGPEDVGSIDVFDLPADAAIEIEQPFATEAPTEQ